MPTIDGTDEFASGLGRIDEAIESACREHGGFAARVEAAFAAATDLLVADPALAGLVADGSQLGRDPYFAWLDRLAAKLRTVAATDPAVAMPPDFIHASLVGGACWLISERIRAGSAADLLALGPGLSECVLVFYSS
jgi:hypothetical protein